MSDETCSDFHGTYRGLTTVEQDEQHPPCIRLIEKPNTPDTPAMVMYTHHAPTSIQCTNKLHVKLRDHVR